MTISVEDILTAIRRYWVRVNLRGVHYNDRHRSLNALYRVPDPWGMESDRERTRFERTNNLIVENIGQVGTCLEVGCGEGHQSEYLTRICKQLYGIDVSERAVERARNRCPQGRFYVGSLDSVQMSEVRRFDLSVACEVLYYLKDVPATLDRLSACSDWCLVSYHDKQVHRLDPYILTKRNANSTTIRYEQTDWTVAWWKNN